MCYNVTTYLVIAAAWAGPPCVTSANMGKEQISVSYNTAYGNLIFTVHTIITLTKQRKLFVSIPNAYTVKTAVQRGGRNDTVIFEECSKKLFENERNRLSPSI